jgi:hypothetical protein
MRRLDGDFPLSAFVRVTPMPATPKPPDDLLEKLRKLCGMLGSDFDGERAVAGRMASDLLREHRLTWADVLGAEAAAAEPVRVWHEPYDHHQAAAQCLAWGEVLTGWEANFLRSISGRWSLSAKQKRCLQPIIAKCRAYARATGGAS